MSYIVIVGPAYPFRGGIATFNESLARTWQAQGHEVEIITFTTQYPSFLFPGKSQLVEGPAPADLKITRELSSVNPASWFALGVKLQKKRPDLVLLRYWLPFMAPALGTVANLVKRNKHTKVIGLTDNVVPHEKRIGDTMLTQYFVNSCNAFVTMSEMVTTDLRKFDKAKPVICQPHPIYDTYGAKVDKLEAQKKLQLPLEDRYILFFGFIRHYKGLDILLEAMKDEHLQMLGVKLIIAGEYYEPEAPYQKLIESEELKGRVIARTEFIPHEEVALFFSAVDLVVQPYRTATQSGVTQIAYHFDKPMVVTKVGGLAEMIPDGKVGYVTEVDAGKIAKAVYQYYSENKEEEMVEQIKEEKKKYSWEKFAEAIIEQYEKL
ncbi:glycosyltransferase [Rufibacter roseus]|uniref:Glycosyltransferase n=1 Tax=Rufibacter roseus TaxID=1567108 RepID=A0ABW2DHT1_9BACT|nr:glycosyltransferase [Rufibacter roseus]